MDQPAPRDARLQAIRDRWFLEPLTATLPPLTDALFERAPANSHELMTNLRVTGAFSSLQEEPGLAGLEHANAVTRDRETNSAHFGVEDPAAVLRNLSQQFETASTGQVDPEVVKKGFVVLDILREDSVSLVRQFDGLLAAAELPDPTTTETRKAQQASHAAEAEALAQAEGIVEDLAAELGISLPINRGVRPRR